MRSIALTSDAYGGRGGIALYNRNFLKALCAYPDMVEVVAVPRSVTYDLEEMPENLTYITSAAGSKLKYLKESIRLALFEYQIDLIICGHLHLLPFAYLLKLFHRCPIVPLTYGVEAWTPTSHGIVNWLCSKLDAFISIRKLTAYRFKQWADIEHAKFYYLPNCIDESKYGIDKRRVDLMHKYSLINKRVIMTAGRLDKGEIDRNKGFDEVLEVLSDLSREMPDLLYLIVGDGNDRERLEKKAQKLGVADIVVFAGYVPDEEKADHFRLADVFAMPGSNEIFDRYPYRFVFLEALACGVPVVGCMLEDESEVNDPDAKYLIIQVNPNDKDDIIKGIIKAFNCSQGPRKGIEKFYFGVFEGKVHNIIDDLLD